MAERQPIPNQPAPQPVPVGQPFGRWTVIGPAAPKTKPRWGTYWRCRCSCPAATERDVAARTLNAGLSTGCGCLAREACTRHGNCRGGQTHPLYPIWSGMLARCLNPKNKDYHNYGARNITVCARWQGKDGLDHFTADMGPRPSPKHSVGRVDNDGPYSPVNCRWATNKEQNRNRRGQRLLTYAGRTQCFGAWAEEFGLPLPVLWHRIARGWETGAALTTPRERCRNK